MKVRCTAAVSAAIALLAIANECLAWNQSPEAILSVSHQSITAPTEVTFDGTYSYDPDGSGGFNNTGIYKFEWDFEGDGIYDYSETYNLPPAGDGTLDGITTHTYTSPGIYDATLRVTDGQGATDIDTFKIFYYADVLFYVESNGVFGEQESEVKIRYVRLNTELEIRSIALRVSLADGTIQGADDVVSSDSNFNCYMDTAFEEGGDYTLGDFQNDRPLADAGGPGLPDFGTGISLFSINMAVFDESGSQGAAPQYCDNLVTLRLHKVVGDSTFVTISEDMLRSSFTKRGMTTNLPRTAEIHYGAPN